MTNTFLKVNDDKQTAGPIRAHWVSGDGHHANFQDETTVTASDTGWKVVNLTIVRLASA